MKKFDQMVFLNKVRDYLLTMSSIEKSGYALEDVNNIITDRRGWCNGFAAFRKHELLRGELKELEKKIASILAMPIVNKTTLLEGFDQKLYDTHTQKSHGSTDEGKITDLQKLRIDVNPTVATFEYLINHIRVFHDQFELLYRNGDETEINIRQYQYDKIFQYFGQIELEKEFSIASVFTRNELINTLSKMNHSGQLENKVIPICSLRHGMELSCTKNPSGDFTYTLFDPNYGELEFDSIDTLVDKGIKARLFDACGEDAAYMDIFIGVFGVKGTRKAEYFDKTNWIINMLNARKNQLDLEVKAESFDKPNWFIKMLARKNQLDLEVKLVKTPLLCAAAFDDEELVQCLTSKRASPASLERTLALFAAVAKRNKKNVETLLGAGANMSTSLPTDASFVKYESCLAMAMRLSIQFDDKALLEIFLRNKADPNLKDDYGTPALHLAIKNHRIGIAQMLLAHGADYEIKDEDDNTALHVAAANGEDTFVQHLLDKKFEPNWQNRGGNTALHFAIVTGHIGIAKMLLAHGADYEIKDEDDNTALHVAAANGHIDIAKILLAHGADYKRKDNYGNTALHLAAATGQAAFVEYWLEKKFELDQQNVGHNTALHLAIKNNHIDIAQMLLAHGTDYKRKDEAGNTALHLAAEEGADKLVEQLLGQGADPNQKNKDGNTAFHLAAIRAERESIGETRCLELLLQGGAKPELRNNRNLTALELVSSPIYKQGIEQMIQTHLNKLASAPKEDQKKADSRETGRTLTFQYGEDSVPTSSDSKIGQKPSSPKGPTGS